MKKTLLLYGCFTAFMGLQGVLVYTMGLELDVATLLPFLVIDGLLIAMLLKADFYGALGLIAALLPFSMGVGQIEIGIVTFNPYVIGILLLFALTLPKISRGLISGRAPKSDFFLILLALSYLVSTLIADDIVGSGFLAFHAIFVPALSYFVMEYAIEDEGNWVKVFSIFMLGIVVFSCFVLGVFIVTQARVYTLGVPPIGAATLLIVPLIGILATNRIKKFPWMIAWPLVLAALITTFTRVYLLTALLSVFLYRFIRKGKGLLLISIFFVSSLAFTFIIASAAEDIEYETADKSQESTLERVTNIDFWKRSLVGRAHSYKYGIDNFLENPIFGVGLYKGEHMVTVHNFNVEWLEYGGILGYLLYTGFFISHFARAAPYARTDKYLAAMLTILTLVMANSTTNGFMHGMMPKVALLLMGMNEARLRLLRYRMIRQRATTQHY
jgi:O-Antigen ligase